MKSRREYFRSVAEQLAMLPEKSLRGPVRVIGSETRACRRRDAATHAVRTTEQPVARANEPGSAGHLGKIDARIGQLSLQMLQAAELFVRRTGRATRCSSAFVEVLQARGERTELAEGRRRQQREYPEHRAEGQSN
jgi:hypothetical protein